MNHALLGISEALKESLRRRFNVDKNVENKKKSRVSVWHLRATILSISLALNSNFAPAQSIYSAVNGGSKALGKPKFRAKICNMRGTIVKLKTLKISKSFSSIWKTAALERI